MYTFSYSLFLAMERRGWSRVVVAIPHSIYTYKSVCPPGPSVHQIKLRGFDPASKFWNWASRIRAWRVLGVEDFGLEVAELQGFRPGGRWASRI